MSYILDALKKADQERMSGDVPDLESVHANSHVKSGIPRWIWGVLVLLIVNGVLLAVLLDGNDAVQPQQPTVATATQPVSPVPPAGMSQMPVIPTPVVPEPVAPEPVISGSVVMPTDSPVVVAEQPKAELARPAVEFATEPLTSTGIEFFRSADTAQPVAEPVSPSVEISTVPPLSTPIPVINSRPVVMPPPTVRQETGRQAAGRQQTGVAYWAELPLDYRAGFELPQLDVHVYSAVPSKRFILVNLRKYREGDELPGGIALDEILSEGLLLTYEGRQFRMQK